MSDNNNTESSNKKTISLLARYDAAMNTRHTAKHWSYADFKSADLDASYEVRRNLRIRARYEVQNNSYAKGICSTIAADTIGIGPHLQIAGNDEITQKIERDWSSWAKAISLTEKLRTARYNKLIDGEAFFLLTTNDKIKHNIKLDVQLIDADRVTSNTVSFTELLTDGMKLDNKGNIISYQILENHPAEAISLKYQDVDAKYIIHLYDVNRAGQHRGVSELSACLELFGQLRDYTRAVLTAAQTAACLTGVIQTDAPAGGEAESIEPMETIELAAGQLLTMPAGWTLGMTKSEQPTTTYAMFKAELLGEISRCLNVPYNIAIGNSNNASYASSRLDWQIYHKNIAIQQKLFEDRCLDKIFAMWLNEWLLSNHVNQPISHSWIWDGISEHSDPYKSAHANILELKNLTTTLSTIYANKGKNWETEIQQIARERKMLKELGLSLDEAMPDNAIIDDNEGEGENEGGNTEDN